MMFTTFDRWGSQTGTLPQIIDAVHYDEVNGSDTLTLTVPDCDLIKGDRIVWQDKFGDWHEHIVDDVRTTHANGKTSCEVYCENSINETYLNYIEDLRSQSVTASVALTKALSVTRWDVGTVEVTGTSSGNFYHVSSREAQGVVAENWGGELETEITVSGAYVSKRALSLLTRRGSDTGKRFVYEKDMESIERYVGTDDVYTALYGYGAGVAEYDSDGELTGGYSRRITFKDINNGLAYVADNDAKDKWGIPDANGNKAHAFGRVVFEDCEDANELLALTQAALAEACEPKVTYTASVIDLADLGYSWEDVRTGDTVQLIDRDLGIRVAGRVLSVERHLLNESATVITIGNATQSITDVISSQQTSIESVKSHAAVWDTASSNAATYIEAMLASLNKIINATGGYTYITQGYGLRTYDVAVSDPTVGSEASQVVEIKGGTIRIANSKDASGNWEWKTVIVSGHVLASLITAVAITSGTITSADGTSFVIDLDNNTISIGGYATTADLAASKWVSSSVIQYASGSSGTTAPASGWSATIPTVSSGNWLWVWNRINYSDSTYSDIYEAAYQAIDGDDGRGISSTAVLYGTSASDSTEPTSWSATAPASLSQGVWLWAKTTITYTDSTTSVSTTKSYIGTDGTDGTSIYVVSSVKSNGTTTVTLSDSTVLTIDDGADGTNGTNGTNGTDGTSYYIHVAWANSSDGSTDFSTTNASGDYDYIGVCTDTNASDPATYASYTWSLIKGADGTNGTDGTSIGTCYTQYYLSTSSTMATGGSWSATVPSSTDGYIWTRTYYTKVDADGNTTAWTAGASYNEPLTQALIVKDFAELTSSALTLGKKSNGSFTGYRTVTTSSGFEVEDSSGQALNTVDANGMKLYDTSGNEIASFDGTTVKLAETGGSSASIEMLAATLVLSIVNTYATFNAPYICVGAQGTQTNTTAMMRSSNGTKFGTVLTANNGHVQLSSYDGANTGYLALEGNSASLSADIWTYNGKLGYTTVASGTGWSVIAADGFCILLVDGYEASLSAWGAVTLTTLSAGYRPPSTITGAIVVDSVPAGGYVKVATSGAVYLGSRSSAISGSGNLCYGQIVWPRSQ